ncbi:MAG: NAD kinase [Bacteroidales bacterium]
MKVALYGKKFTSDFEPYFEEIAQILKKNQLEVVIHNSFFDSLPDRLKHCTECEFFSCAADLPKDTDAFLSIGGDGTFLDSVTYVRETGIPIAGINSGRLGFLANISKEEIKQAIEKIAKNDFHIEERELIELSKPLGLFNDFQFALNELTISKKDSSAMITVTAYLNGEYLNTYWADGLIVATTTGSTAYSLSAGGPIVVPEAQNFIITPLAPHNLTVRPLVVSNNLEITLKISGRDENYLVSLDRRYESLTADVELKINKASFRIKVIKNSDLTFFRTLRKKLMWGLDVRN